jgi:hypothetical protein
MTLRRLSVSHKQAHLGVAEQQVAAPLCASRRRRHMHRRVKRHADGDGGRLRGPLRTSLCWHPRLPLLLLLLLPCSALSCDTCAVRVVAAAHRGPSLCKRLRASRGDEHVLLACLPQSACQRSNRFAHAGPCRDGLHPVLAARVCVATRLTDGGAHDDRPKHQCCHHHNGGL